MPALVGMREVEAVGKQLIMRTKGPSKLKFYMSSRIEAQRGCLHVEQYFMFCIVES